MGVPAFLCSCRLCLVVVSAALRCVHRKPVGLVVFLLNMVVVIPYISLRIFILVLIIVFELPFLGLHLQLLCSLLLHLLHLLLITKAFVVFILLNLLHALLPLPSIRLLFLELLLLFLIRCDPFIVHNYLYRVLVETLICFPVPLELMGHVLV